MKGVTFSMIAILVGQRWCLCKICGENGSHMAQIMHHQFKRLSGIDAIACCHQFVAQKAQKLTSTNVNNDVLKQTLGRYSKIFLASCCFLCIKCNMKFHLIHKACLVDIEAILILTFPKEWD